MDSKMADAIQCKQVSSGACWGIKIYIPHICLWILNGWWLIRNSFGIVVDTRFIATVKKVNSILGIIRKELKIELWLYKSMVWPHLEYYVQFWSPHFKKNVVGKALKRATKMIKGMEQLPFEERFQCLELSSIEKTWVIGEYKHMYGAMKVDREFSSSSSSFKALELRNIQISWMLEDSGKIKW